MDDLELNYSQAVELIKGSQRILLVSHRRPDGDTLGASVALFLALNALGKKPVAACIDPIPTRLQFLSKLLPSNQNFVREFSIDDFDLIIISDAGASHMTGFHEKYSDFLSKRVPILNLDHHASNDNFGTVNVVDINSSSATMVVAALLKKLGISFTKESALALLAGIYNDTGGFIHSNTHKKTFELAAELAACGVRVQDIVKPLFREATLAQLKLWGFILENLHKNEKNVVSSVVTDSDLHLIGAHASDTGGIIDLMSTVPDAQFTMLLAEDDGVVKGSLRTQRDDVNVSALASRFGGGGHAKASGFRVHGRLEREVQWKIVASNV